VLIYFLIAFCATIIGSIAGMGGGVIIKPMMDLIGEYNIVSIAVISSITVLSMAIVSTFRQVKNGFKITYSMIYITIGAIIGGIIGSLIFSSLKSLFNPNVVTAVQSITLILLLIMCLIYERIAQKHIHKHYIQMIIGFSLGVFSSFLGIGGGPINVAVLYVLLGYSLRDAAKVSVFIILFSQIAGLITKAIGGLFAQVQDYSVLYVMVPAAIIGGFLGAHFNMKISDNAIKVLFKSSVIVVILICVLNAYRSIA